MIADDKRTPLELIIEQMIGAAHDSDWTGNVKYADDKLMAWKKILGDLEITHYFCMDARRIVKRKIKNLERKAKKC